MTRTSIPVWVAAALLAFVVQSTAVGAETRFSNDSVHTNGALPGLSISAISIQQTATAARLPSSPSTTIFMEATTTDHAFPGCSTDCTYDKSRLSQHHISWTKCQDTVMLGRVHYFVDRVNNKTSTSTDFAHRVTFLSNGSQVTSDASDILASVLTRTDVNAAGTVTFTHGTHTMAYPTGFNVLPSFYVWNGTLPYTTNGTTACATANNDVTTLVTEKITYSYIFSSEFTTSIHSATETVIGATPLPSVENLPTLAIYNVDEQDPKGWTYCYHLGNNQPVTDDFYSPFSGDLFDQVIHNCTPRGYMIAPLVAVNAAAFLLDETTSYVDSTRTEHSDISRPQTTKSSQSSTHVLADPFHTTSKLSSIQTSASLERASDNPSNAPKLAQSIAPNTIDQPNSDQLASEDQAAKITAPLSGSKEPPATAAATKPSAKDNTTPDDASQQISATSPGVQPKVKSSVAMQTITTSSGLQIDALNSLIQDIGQIQPSSPGEIVASPAGISSEMVSHTSEATIAATTSVLPEPIIIGTSTATVNSDGDYLIGTHVLQPTDSPFELQGTTYALDSSRSALIVNGILSYTIEPAQHASDNPQPAALTVNGVTVTPNYVSAYVVETQTLKPGGPAITVSGTRISLASDAAAIVIGTQTSVLSRTMGTHEVTSIPPHASDNPQPATLTINGITVAPNSASNYVIETQTLKPGGPAITVSGTRISLASDAGAIVVGSQTSVLSTTTGVGDYVWAGIAGMLSAASESANPLPGTPNEELSTATTSSKKLTETTNNVSQLQTSTSSTDLGTASQLGPNAASSSPSSSSSLIETSSENKSGRVAISASLAIGMLSLVVAIAV